ncbi:MAG: GNAT family N-acetyltransferase [Actinomycetota bacterium]
MGVRVRPLRADERDWARSLMLERWGDETAVGHGVVWRPAELDAFVAQDDDGSRVGLLTFDVGDDVLEVVTIDALREREGIGTALMLAAIERAHAAAVTTVRVMTTNDNEPAIAFYEHLGFRVTEVREGAVADARALKPSIPLVGVGGVPITDEVILELRP